MSRVRCRSTSTKETSARGFEDIGIVSTFEYLSGIHSAIIKATKPATGDA